MKTEVLPFQIVIGGAAIAISLDMTTILLTNVQSNCAIAAAANSTDSSSGKEERDWLDWLKKANDRTITPRQAAEQMGVTERWVQKLLRERM